jgi:hypothetical protein
MQRMVVDNVMQANKLPLPLVNKNMDLKIRWSPRRVRKIELMNA